MDRRRFHEFLAVAVVLGVLVGLTATGFRVVWLLVKHELWGTLTETYWRVVVSVVAGGLIGLILSRTFYPGALSALIAQFHDEGAVPIEDNVPTLPVGLLGLVAGQQAGPEGVMSVVGGSFGTWVADRFGVVGSRKLLTLAGMGAGFGTILGAPIGGALLWLELPHQRGLEYYEALVPTFVASFAGYLTEAGLGRLVVRWRPELRTGPFGLFPSWHVTAVGPLTLHHLAVAVGLGVLVVPVAAFYVETFDVVGALLDRADPPLPARTTLAGLGIGLLGWVLPLSYFYGASKMPTLLAGDRTPLVLVATLLACMIAAGLTIKGGWLGGLIVPHMFMGAIVGKIAALLVPGVGPVVAMLAAMAAFNAVVTGTPLSSALIAISLTDGAAIVPVFLASIAGFVASPYVEFLETAATRHEQPNFHLDD